MRLYLVFNSVVEFTSLEDKQSLEDFQKIFDETWLDSSTGLGFDAKGLTHTRPRVTGVMKLKNTKLWRRYSQRRIELQQRARAMSGGRFIKVGDLVKTLADGRIR